MGTELEARADMTVQVGDLVWQQLYQPDSGKTKLYGPRRLMKLAGMVPYEYDPDEHLPRLEDGITRYWLINPDRPNDQSLMSWCESDWCDLEPANEDSGMLF